MRRITCTAAVTLCALIGVSHRVLDMVPARLVIVASGGQGGYDVSASGSGRRIQPASTEPIFMPFLVTHAGIRLAVSCVSYRTISDPNPASYPMLLVAAQALWARLANYPRCTAVSGAAHVITTAWYAFVHTSLPLPAAHITPRIGVVNLPLAVGASGLTEAHATVPTPDGPLSITASGTIWLVTPEGSPVPMTLVPTSTATVQIRAVEEWSGTYRLGATEGALPRIVIKGHSAWAPVIALSSQLNAVS